MLFLLLKAAFLSTLVIIPLSILWILLEAIITGTVSIGSVVTGSAFLISYGIPIALAYIITILVPVYLLFEKLQLQKISLYLAIGLLVPLTLTIILFRAQLEFSMPSEQLYFVSLPCIYGLLVTLTFYYVGVSGKYALNKEV